MPEEHKPHDFSQTPQAHDSPMNALLASGIPWPRKPTSKPGKTMQRGAQRGHRMSKTHKKAMR